MARWRVRTAAISSKPGYAPLVRDYVRGGQLSYEFRNILLNAPDIAATMLAHCAGPGRFFGMAEAIYDASPNGSEGC